MAKARKAAPKSGSTGSTAVTRTTGSTPKGRTAPKASKNQITRPDTGGRQDKGILTDVRHVEPRTAPTWTLGTGQDPSVPRYGAGAGGRPSSVGSQRLVQPGHWSA